MGARTTAVGPAHDDDPGVLVAAVLDEEARRQSEQHARTTNAVRPELLAGVGGDELPFRQVLQRGGAGVLGVLSGLVLVDALDGTAFGVLAPDIRRSLGLTLTQIGVIGALGGLVVFLAAIPLGSLGDRYRRVPIVGACTLVFAAFAALTGAVQTVWQLVIARVVVGVGKANEGPVQGSLIADAYPIEGRNRVFAVVRGAQTLGFIVGPALVGGAAALVGGDASWRWAFVVVAVPAAALGVAAFFLSEPRRGKHEMLAVLGEELEAEEDALPIPLSAGFARLKKIRTFNYFILAVAVVGLSLVSVPIYISVFLHDHYGLGPSARGLVGSFGGIGGVVGVVVGGTAGDRLFVRSPAASCRIAAFVILASGAFTAASVFMPNAVLYTVIAALAGACTFGGFVTVQGVGAAVMPYRLRSTGMAMISLYLSLFGGLLGSIVLAQLASATSLKTAIAVIAATAAAGGGGLLAYGSRFVEYDMAQAAADLIEERDERARVAQGGAQPILQVRNLDFSYGAVQVLFDVSIDVWEGEVLALLGTNGAGKSTVLRAITGLSQPDRGVIRLGGRTITFAEPGTRLTHGIVQVPGGKATFPNLSVEDNLRARGFSVRRRDLDPRIDHALERFPVLRSRLDQPAGTLSGGEQQMLAIAGALLLEPKVLLIDELSLGLAPIMVQQLLEVVAALKDDGLTMVIVEQSINVALSIADRAVFMEKGQVRFEGPALELLERDDLVRAVFLGGEGG